MSDKLDQKIIMLDRQIEMWNKRKSRFDDRIKQLTDQKATIEAAKAEAVKVNEIK